MTDLVKIGLSMIGVAIIITIAVLIIGLITYILQSIGLYRIAMHQGMTDKAILAWIPIGNLFLIGDIVDSITIMDIHIDNMGITYPTSVIIGSAISTIPMVSTAVIVILNIWSVIVYMKIMEKYEESMVLRVIYAIFSPIGLYIIGRRAKEMTQSRVI